MWTKHWCESASSCSWPTYCCWSGNLWWCSLWGRFRMWSNRLYWPGLFGCQLLQTYLPLVKHFLYIFEFLYNSLGIGLDKEKANNKWLSALDWASEERICSTRLRLEITLCCSLLQPSPCILPRSQFHRPRHGDSSSVSSTALKKMTYVLHDSYE